MNKYLVHPKIRRLKPYLLMSASLVILDGFYPLLSTQLTADLTPEWSGESMFHPLSHIYANKNSFFCVETVTNNALSRWRVVVFDRLWANATSILITAFSLTYVHVKWWIHCLLISSFPLLSHVTSIYNPPNEFVEFFRVFLDNYRIWVIWAFSIICVCKTAFKFSLPPLNRFFFSDGAESE